MPDADDAKTFLLELGRVLDRADAAFAARAEDNPIAAPLYLAARVPIKGVRPELGKLMEIAGDPEIGEGLSRVVSETGAAQLVAAINSGAEGQPLADAKDGLELGQSILDKAAGYLPPPFDGAAENVGQVLGIIGQLAGDSSSTDEKLQELADSLSEIGEEIDKIEGKAERVGTLLGHPVVTGDEAELVDPPGPEGYAPPDIRGSVLWMAWQNQRKLEHLWRHAAGLDYPQASDGRIQPPPARDGLRGLDAWLRDNGGHFGLLAHKIDKLAELLGKAIVHADAEWDPEPEIGPGRTIAPGVPDPHNQLPKKAVKQELHEIEDLLRGLRRLLKKLLKIDIVDIDVDIDVVINIFKTWIVEVLEERPLKRIYVVDEGVFQAAGPRQRKRVAVRTPAFDLAGWVDLDDLRVGDRVAVDVYVYLPGPGGRPRRRLYRSATFVGRPPARPGRRNLARREPTGRGLKSLQDICGPTIIVGTAVDVVLRQPRSADGYPSGLAIAYQLVVESSDDPERPSR